MAKQTNLYITKAIKNISQSIANADNLAMKVLFTAGVDDSVVKSLMCASDETVSRNVALWLNDGASDRLLGTVNVPLNAGFNGTVPTVDLLAGLLLPGLPFDQNGKRVLPMQAGYILKASVTVQVTAAKTMHISGVAEDY